MLQSQNKTGLFNQKLPTLDDKASVVERSNRKATGEFQHADESEDGCIGKWNFRQILCLAELIQQHSCDRAVALVLLSKISNIELEFSILYYFLGKCTDSR